jgi:DNA polymerase-3 subunit alpha
MEKEMTGLYISGHPLDEYKKSLAMQTSTTIEEIYKANDILKESMANEIIEETFIDATINDNDKVILGGIITEVKQKVTRNNKMMAFLKLEDLTGTIEIIVFPRTLDKLREQIKEDSLVRIQGRVNLKEDEMPKLICENIEGLEKVNDSKLYIKAKDKKNVLEISSQLKTLIKGYEGNTPVYVFADEERQNFRMTNDKWVELEEELIDILKQRFGDGNIKIVD